MHACPIAAAWISSFRFHPSEAKWRTLGQANPDHHI